MTAITFASNYNMTHGVFVDENTAYYVGWANSFNNGQTLTYKVGFIMSYSTPSCLTFTNTETSLTILVSDIIYTTLTVTTGTRSTTMAYSSDVSVMNDYA